MCSDFTQSHHEWWPLQIWFSCTTIAWANYIIDIYTYIHTYIHIYTWINTWYIYIHIISIYFRHIPRYYIYIYGKMIDTTLRWNFRSMGQEEISQVYSGLGSNVMIHLAGDISQQLGNITGWWFGTCFPYIGKNIHNWLIFFRGVETTNQINFP